MEKFVIAIDGGAATGKSTIAKAIANKLNVLYIDSGAMYRAVALYYINNNIEVNEANVCGNMSKIDIKLQYVDGKTIVYLNNVDVTQYIRTEQVSYTTSIISKFQCVRDKLVDMQRQMAQGESLVMDGRDITTVVFPNAKLKLYVTASLDIRAIRRQKDLVAAGQNDTIQQVKEALSKRDIADSTREIAPLKQVEDAILIDTTNDTVENIVENVITILNERVNE